MNYQFKAIIALWKNKCMLVLWEIQIHFVTLPSNVQHNMALQQRYHKSTLFLGPKKLRSIYRRNTYGYGKTDLTKVFQCINGGLRVMDVVICY